jgi:hypothetical protein
MQHHFPNDVPTFQHEASLNERINSSSRFRRVLEKVHPVAIDELDYRRERQVFLLTDGKRSIAQIAGLLRIPPVEVAQMTKMLLERGYIEL